MKKLGQPEPEASEQKFKVMGKEFDVAEPDKYLNRFTIRNGSLKVTITGSRFTL